MASVEFDEEQNYNSGATTTFTQNVYQQSGMEKILAKLGIPEEYMTVASIVIALLFFAASIYFFVGSGSSKPKPVPLNAPMATPSV